MIGGIPVADVFGQIELHFFFENYIERQVLLPHYFRDMDMLWMAGSEIIDNNRAEVVLLSNGEQQTVEIPFIRMNANDLFREQSFDEEIQFGFIDDDIFLITIFRHAINPSFDAMISAVEEAIENGITNFIIDLRQSPGGTSMVWLGLLEAMEFSDLSVREFLRTVSDFTSMQEDLFTSEDGTYQYFPRTFRDADNPNNVFIAALTSNFTYSAGMALALAVQDSGLGIIIGEPSINAPSSFGSMLRLTLPFSRLEISVSESWFGRANPNADPYVLRPDIEVESELALEVALEFLRGMD